MLSPEAEKFVKYDFAITVDLCKQFITLVAGILVFSLTFSEKIVNFTSAKRSLRIVLGLSWTLLLFAIIACGLGLTYMSIAGGEAVYGAGNSFYVTAQTSYQWIVAAGSSFIGGLVCLIYVAIARAFSA